MKLFSFFHKVRLKLGRTFLLCNLLVLSPLLSQSHKPAFVNENTPAGKYEVRAVWLSVASGDWPASFDVEEQQRSLIEILDVMRKNNFNTVFFQVRPRGNTLYQSEIEPWAKQLTGVLGKDPGWDPLQFAIEETRKRGIELHAWFNVAKVWGADSPPSRPEHIVNKHREWVRQVENEWWIDLGNPAAREYTERVAMELVEKYDIDGIHFDFVRYPNASFNDWLSFSTWSDGMEKDEWRRNNITSFVRNCYDRIHAMKPWVKVGSAPVGIYQAINGAQSSFTGYGSVFQDSRLWLREGIHDYIVPQLYWSIGEQQNPNDPDFTALCIDWARKSYGRHVYVGIGVYRENIQDEIKEQVIVSRASAMLGQSYFRYSQLQGLLPQLGDVYRYPALIPSMKWKDSIPPLPPEKIVIESNNPNVNVIHWNEPSAASDGEKPFRYAVYRSSSTPVDIHRAENILAVLPAERRVFVDAEVQAFGGKKIYTVTSLDRCWNESEDTITAENENFFSKYPLKKQMPMLSQSVFNPTSGKMYFSFELPQRDTVLLTIKHAAAEHESVIVNGVKSPGVHIMAVDVRRFPEGMIEYTLKTADTVLTKVMEKK